MTTENQRDIHEERTAMKVTHHNNGRGTRVVVHMPDSDYVLYVTAATELRDALTVALDEIALTIEPVCTHEKTERGADIPLVYGSHRSEVCKACGSFRRRDHCGDLVGEYKSRWRPPSEYAHATTAERDP